MLAFNARHFFVTFIYASQIPQRLDSVFCHVVFDSLINKQPSILEA